MRFLLLTLLSAVLLSDLIAQGTPTSLRPDITVEHYMDVRSSAARMAYDHLQQRMYYLRTNGEVLMVIDNGIDPPYDTLLFTVSDHDITDAFAIAFHDSDLFVIGNHVMGDQTQGMLKRGHLQSNGTRNWSAVATTGTYAWGGKAHGFNNVVVSPDGQYLYLNCGSRTDHGEVQSVGGLFPGLREEPITAKILRVPTNGVDLILPNDETQLAMSGYLFASGLRNTFDMAFDPQGHLFGVENSGDHDDPEEMNWLREGLNYGFPWYAGDNPNPTRFPGYDPATDPLLNPGYPSASTDFYYDPDFPLEPWIDTQPPIRNVGPDADRLRDANGGMVDATDVGSGISTFTCHRSPLGLVFDTNGTLDGDLHRTGFLLSFTPGGDTSGYSPIAPWGIPVVPADPSEDLLHIELNYDQVNDAYTLSATRIVEGFYLPVDAELVGNALYVIENWGSTQRSMWKVTMPIFSGLEESPAPSVARLSAWPVPASDAVHWSCAGLTPRSLELLDPAGRLVRSERPAASSGTIDLGGIPGGAYVLRAHSATTTSSSRIIIAR